VDWIGLAEDGGQRRALMNVVINFRIPWNAGKLLRGCTTGRLSSSARLQRISYGVLLLVLRAV
jgi:hypothetical protein